MDEENLNKYEKLFIEVYGQNHFYEICNFIKENDIMDIYKKSRNEPEGLCHFGFHYGLITIVSFCYCKLKLSLQIHDVINEYFKFYNSTTRETNEKVFTLDAPIIHQPNANDGLLVSTLDKYTPERTKCMDYLLKMIKFSKCRISKEKNKIKYVYTIVDKYIEHYRLLEVN